MSVTDRITEHLKKIDLRHGYMYLVARDLGYSVPNLDKKLRAEGSHYRDLLDAERRRRVSILLSHSPDSSKPRVAKAAGYSVNSIGHAMRRWFDMSLTSFRRQA